MSKYEVIAFDMDGTLLNSWKQISEHTLEAINRAFDAGKEVILSTGRCVAELREYFKRIPRLRYVVCSSGAILYDVKEDIDQIESYRDLETIHGLFNQVQLDPSRTCVYWNDEIDLPSDTLYEYGMAIAS